VEGDLAGIGLAEVQRHGVAEDGEIEAGFVAEMVVDGGDVGVGAGADFADGGGLEAVFGEDLTGSFDEAGAGGIGGFRGGSGDLETSCHLNSRLKQLFMSGQEINAVWVVNFTKHRTNDISRCRYSRAAITKADEKGKCLEPH